jgi:hypothetical protein
MSYALAVVLVPSFQTEEIIMKFEITKKIAVIVFIGLFSQFSMADNASAMREIAGIVATLNHFPSDADKAKLAAISADDSIAQGLRDMATAVANISHGANDEGKAAMARIIANDQAPDAAKSLAGIIANISHMPSDEAKATLASIAQ